MAEQWTPAVVEKIRGIAEGAQVAFETLFAYNLADEQQIYFDREVHDDRRPLWPRRRSHLRPDDGHAALVRRDEKS